VSYHAASAALPDPGAACGGCGLDVRGLGEFGYMVADAAWAESGGGPGKLCVGCLEGRLGRRLAPGDFPPLPCNDPFRLRSAADAPRDPGEWWFQFRDQSDRLLDRLGVRPADAAAARALPGWPHGPPPFLALRRVAAIAAGYGAKPARPGRPDRPVRGAGSLFGRRTAMDVSP
jgi:hypothetical protein